MEDEYKNKIIATEESCKSAHRRIASVENKVDDLRELVGTVKVIATETKSTKEVVNDMNNRLKEVEKKPAKKWEDIEKLVITRNSNSYFGLFFS